MAARVKVGRTVKVRPISFYLEVVPMNLSALALLPIAFVNPAVAGDLSVLGFSKTEKTTNDYLADGYEIKSSFTGMGVGLVLQKGTSAAICNFSEYRHQCVQSLDPSAAREKVKAAEEEQKKPHKIPDIFNR